MLFYRILSILLFPFLEIYLYWRVYKQKEDKKRLKERFGHATIFRPKTSIIWVHAVSVGEANSALILIEELLNNFPESSILFTTTTVTSAEIVGKKIADFEGRVIHQFLPIDSYSCVMNFFIYWRPKIAIFVESEIWPNLIDVADRSGAAIFLVNARMSKESASKWRFAKNFGFNIFDRFSAIFAQSENDQKRFQSLTEREVFFLGNLKSQAQSLSYNPEELMRLKNEIGTRKFWLAASTHKGEEELIIAAHRNLKKNFPDLLTIIVLRHPQRAQEVKDLMTEIKFSQRSCKENIENSTDIYLVDTLNELGIFYRLANFAFIGGSLIDIGGHNPFEAIKLNCAVISGRNVKNFQEVYSKLESENSCIMIDSKDELEKAVSQFLTDQHSLESVISNATKLTSNSNKIASEIAENINFISEISDSI